jgi:hypothetical protein
MSFSVGIHAPKTPITAGSGGVAKATIPNVCKMPGPPAPFVPSPLPNIAKSGNSPKDYSTSVFIEGEKIAIRGATFESIGDIASKGTGGGLISANTQGIAKFIVPGTMDVKIEGKGVHLKGDQVLNNCASGGTPPNTGATMGGTDQISAQKIKTIKKLLCDEFCNEYPNWESSYKLEQRLKDDPEMAKQGLKFPPDTATPHTFNGITRVTIPDAMLSVGDLRMCFDFKGPGDRWRPTQRARQTAISRPRRAPIEISKKACKC